MTILAYALLAWLAGASLATFGWVIFVEVCRYHERRHRAERWEPARYQSGSAHPALRPGAARGAAHASARPEPDPTIHRP